MVFIHLRMCGAAVRPRGPRSRLLSWNCRRCSCNGIRTSRVCNAGPGRYCCDARRPGDVWDSPRWTVEWWLLPTATPISYALRPDGGGDLERMTLDDSLSGDEVTFPRCPFWISWNEVLQQNKRGWTSESTNPSINQSSNPSIHPSINQSINPSINQSINQSSDQLAEQSINQSIEPWRTADKVGNQSIKYSSCSTDPICSIVNFEAVQFGIIFLRRKVGPQTTF